ncbi:YceI family protein [uncultured Imperialibacter sp.]|uniref:YceI family protein n=1 Tax=uncultured Imperialibacter sp. TaxID=1672639 RepID=UPI0030D979A7|tara:strand:+ start:28188 stop:28760 length:573 start_codon:yes stop_codon:yes gene_type:complete
MKKLLTLIFAVASTQLFAQSWELDKSHTNIKFTVTHMVVSEVDGTFGDFSGTVTGGDDKFVGAAVEFTAQTASVDTDSERRDTHLKSDDFFNAEKFPTIKFSGKIVNEGGKYYLAGNFTMRDVTKPVKFDVKYNGKVDTGRGMKAGFKVTGAINRFDYGLKWDAALEAGGLVVADEVQITCNVELNAPKS